jgi:hypothetical protein
MMPLSHPFSVAYEAVFENGTIEYTENSYSDRCDNSLTLFTDSSKKDLEIPGQNYCAQSVRHVIECCTKDIPTISSLNDAIESLKIALQVKDSILKGK